MARNERTTCREVIEPLLSKAGWDWDEQLRIGPGRVNITGDSMYDESQAIVADYLLRYRGIPLAILEAKAESESAADGMQQASRYARRLMIRFSIASNGSEWIITDNDSGEFETIDRPPTPDEIVSRLGISIDWDRWSETFAAGYHVDQVSKKTVRPYQDMAIAKTLWQFAQGDPRALLLMATGTGKTFAVFQLIWKMMHGGSLPKQHVLFLTDRNSLKDQAYRAFQAFGAAERVRIDKETVAKGNHLVGKVFFANYQTLDEELNGKKVYEHYDPDFFDLVIIDECHRSGFGDWFGVLQHFTDALQLGLTATPREIEETNRVLVDEERRRDTYHYFGDPIFVYSLKQAIEDGYLVPYLMEERVTNVDQDGFDGPDGRHYATDNFERDNWDTHAIRNGALEPERRLDVLNVDTPPGIDSAVWDTAPEQTLIKSDSKPFVNLTTTMKVLRDKDALYVFVKGLAPRMHPEDILKKPPDGDIFKDEYVELGISPPNADGKLYRIAVNPAEGCRFDSIVTAEYDRTHEDTSWNGTWEYATQTTGKKGQWTLPGRVWTVWFRVPFADFGRQAPEPGETWGFNVGRERRSPYLIWQNGRSAATPNALGKLLHTGDRL